MWQTITAVGMKIMRCSVFFQLGISQPEIKRLYRTFLSQKVYFEKSEAEKQRCLQNNKYNSANINYYTCTFVIIDKQCE